MVRIGFSDIAGEEVVNDVQNVYNGFRQLVTQYQQHGAAVDPSTSPSVQYSYADGSANTVRRTGIVYPNGRVLNYVYNSGDDDNLSRVSSIGDDSFSPLAAYTYLGAGSIVVADYQQPGIQYSLISGNVVAWDSFMLAQWQAFTLDQWEAFRLDVSPYGGLDQFDRIINNLWQTDGETPVAIDQVNYGYDLASNRLWRQNPVAQANSQNRDELYAYDGLYQLLDLSRGQLNDDETAINSGTLNFAQAWELDPTGNWTDYKEDDTGGGFTFYETRAANTVNEITALTTTDPDRVTPAYDDNGNMTTMPQPTAPSSSYTAVYDAWNRLVSLSNGDDIVVQYEYDGLGRRVTKGIGGTIRDYYYSDSWQVLEEWLSSAVERQFVWGLRYIDDLVLRDRDPDGSGSLSERIYPLQDANANVTAQVDDAGAVLERYMYSAYGVLNVLNPDFSVKGGSPSYDWETLYASYRWTANQDFISPDTAFLHPPLGVWITRDPIGSAGDAWNPYRYVLNQPIASRDPSGLTQQVFVVEGNDLLGNFAEDYLVPAAEAAGGAKVHYRQYFHVTRIIKDIRKIWASEKQKENMCGVFPFTTCIDLFDTIVLVGYSWGADAVAQIVEELSATMPKPDRPYFLDLVFTVDPVLRQFQENLRKPHNVLIWKNYYETFDSNPKLRGKSIFGADVDENVTHDRMNREMAPKTLGLPVPAKEAHITMPQLPSIQKDLTDSISAVPVRRSGPVLR